jgi:hypothetical protein
MFAESPSNSTRVHFDYAQHKLATKLNNTTTAGLQNHQLRIIQHDLFFTVLFKRYRCLTIGMPCKLKIN